MDTKQRKQQQAEGRPERRVRPILLATVLIILLWMIASVYFHTRFPRYF